MQIRKSHLGCHWLPAGGYCHRSGVGGGYAGAPSSASLHSLPGYFKAHLVVGSVKPAALYPILSLLTGKAGDFQLGIRSDRTGAVTSSTITAGSRRDLVAGPSLWLGTLGLSPFIACFGKRGNKYCRYRIASYEFCRLKSIPGINSVA